MPAIKPPLLSVLLFAALVAQAGEVRPTWELGRDPIPATAMTGTVEIANGVVRLDGTNRFTVPMTALGAQLDYTIEFELKRPATGSTDTDNLIVASNMDAKAGTGLAFRYFPPTYNTFWLLTNGNRTIENRGFAADAFAKVTIVAKDGRLALFVNGLIIATTDVVKPSPVPLAFGEVKKAQVPAYELRNIRLYDQAVFPTGFDLAADRMRTYSGDQFSMQRVEVKDPSLPRLLVIGDSISMAYRRFITEHFQGRAYVDYWVQGYPIMDGDNSPGERAFTGVLAQGPYDVVTFNFGLHWWNPKHPTRAPDDKFPGYMEKLVRHLVKTAPATRFIWVRATPFMTAVDGKPNVIDPVQSDRLIRNNAITDGIMKQAGIPCVDLYAICEKNLDKASKDGVHWNEAASKLFATEIIGAVETALQAKRSTK